MYDLFTSDNWMLFGYWTVAIFAVVAAWIDGTELRVPNKLTLPFVVAGWVFSMVAFELQGSTWYAGLGYSLLGTAVGCLTLLPFYAIGGMGGGDVKMMMGIGAWVGTTIVFHSFCVGAIVGGVMAVVMALRAGQWSKHYNQFFSIFYEIMSVRDPEKLAVIAKERKPSMHLLPYGIPMAIGTLMYMGWERLLV